MLTIPKLSSSFSDSFTHIQSNYIYLKNKIIIHAHFLTQKTPYKNTLLVHLLFMFAVYNCSRFVAEQGFS